MHKHTTFGSRSVFAATLTVCAVIVAGCAGSPSSLLEADPNQKKTSLLGTTAIDRLGSNSTDKNQRVRAFADRDDKDLVDTNFNKSRSGVASSVGNLEAVSDLPPPQNSQGGTLQFISPNDKLEIDVLRVDELDRKVEVDSTGKISLPLVGEVVAAGKTKRQLESDLVKRYGSRYLESPQITVNVIESAGQRVTVDGEVRRAGIYPISSKATLMRAVSLAQGFTNLADPTKVYVFRQVGEKKYVANYSVDAIRSAQRPDPRIYGGDVVVVFQSSAKVAMENLKSVLGVATSAGRLAVLP